MLSMISISAPQNNRTCFKNNITSTKLAKQKLSKLYTLSISWISPSSFSYSI